MLVLVFKLILTLGENIVTTKGKSWKWSEGAKKRQSEARKGKKGAWGKGLPTHGLSQTKEYNHWKKMMYRCYNPSSVDYVNYGGRGIQVCDRWHDVKHFVADMGTVPSVEARMSVERVDVNGNYEPKNCIWLPLRLQAKNRRPWKHSKKGLEAISAARRK